MNSVLAEGVKWNLDDLYTSQNDPKIEEDLKNAESKALDFEKKYKPFFENKDQNEKLPLADLLKDYKEIARLSTRSAVYSQLAFSAATNDQAISAFMQKIRVRLTDMEAHLLFFEVGWNNLEQNVVDKLLSDPAIEPDRHFLENMRIYVPHTLKEGEEKIMSAKANTAGHAFSRLFDEIMNNIPFTVEIEGKQVRQTEAQVLALLHSQSQQERVKGSDSLAKSLKENTRILTYIYNMILADHRTNMKIRSYKHPMDPRNLSNETDLESVTGLIKSVKEAYPIAIRYYHLKKKLLGLEKLHDYDRYAPVSTEESKVPFEKAKEIILSGYYTFSDQCGKIVEEFFEKNWIDAEIREGKQGGAFCCDTLPELHPYVLMNYTGSMRDVMTLAHELGHGIHQYLAGKGAGILETSAPLTLAETASVFGEMLIFEKILSEESDPTKQLHLICGKIDDNFATVYRQIAMTDFELKAHLAGIKEGELSSEQLSDFWIEANAEFYGDSVVLTENYRHGWKYIPHFVHTPFYCYAYSFAQLFVLTLFQKYKENKEAFIPKYLEMLSLGGSKKPEEIAAIQGLNIRDPHFWDSGIKLLDDLVKQAEALAQR